jgi:hypothetical protein
VFASGWIGSIRSSRLVVYTNGFLGPVVLTFTHAPGCSDMHRPAACPRVPQVLFICAVRMAIRNEPHHGGVWGKRGAFSEKKKSTPVCSLRQTGLVSPLIRPRGSDFIPRRHPRNFDTCIGMTVLPKPKFVPDMHRWGTAGVRDRPGKCMGEMPHLRGEDAYYSNRFTPMLHA